jgi:hypothetical protein
MMIAASQLVEEELLEMAEAKPVSAAKSRWESQQLIQN